MATVQEINKAKQTAYELGQNDGYANKVACNPFDARTQDAEWCAYMDGHEDGQNQYANECKFRA